ncbi:MAG: hypothetical protein ABI210_14645, partial [Abditibacteriaceae bacterium]
MNNSHVFPLTEVKPHNGAPALFLNGAPLFPLFLMTGPAPLAQLIALEPTGVHLQTDVFPFGWVGIGTFDYSAFDEMVAAYLAADTEALLMPRLHLDPPEDWMAAHPDELVGYADPQAWDGETCWGGPRHPSFASKPWRADTSDALRRLIQHVAQSGYADRIIGWHIGSGVYGEWHAWNGVYYPDTSAP